MCMACIGLRSVRKVALSKRINLKNNEKPRVYDVKCSSCGALIKSTIKSTHIELPEQMCLICHARMLNEYFQQLNKKDADERR